MKKTKSKKALTTSQLKKKLDKIFSEYIRKKYADKRGYAQCYTCGIRKSWKEMQCGHFASRAHLATRFEEKNCRVQCVGCNIFGDGRVAIFAGNLEKEQKGIVSILYRDARKIVKYYPYEAKIEEYTQKLKELAL